LRDALGVITRNRARTHRDSSFRWRQIIRTAFGCIGIKGGKPGAPGYSVKNPGTPREEYVYFSRDVVPVKAGDTVRLATPGGGGWGDPLERTLEEVRDQAIAHKPSHSLDLARIHSVHLIALPPLDFLDVEAPVATTTKPRGFPCLSSI
jgi:N-methylhydantoinase B/oxoprolinase/acetone carboxylase alpha subunit